MSNMVDSSHALLSLNPQLELAGNVFLDNKSQIRESTLSHYVRTFAHDVIESTADLSLFSEELENALNTDELRSAFSPDLYKHLLALEFPEMENVLDLTQDLGGVSHFLSSRCQQLDSIKIDIARAKLSAKRLSQIDSIVHLSENPELINLPADHYDLIVIGELNELDLNLSQLKAFFAALTSALTREGLLVFISNNADHLGKYLSKGSKAIPYADLYQTNEKINFNSQQLKTFIEQTGIKYNNQFASFSTDQKLSNLFARDYLRNNANAFNHFNRIGAIGNTDLNEYLLFNNISKEEIFNFASRYLLIGGNELACVNAFCQINFAHFPGHARKAQWRTVTANRRGSNLVSKTPILNEEVRFQYLTQSTPTPKLVQDIGDKPFHHGPLLLADWLSSAINSDVKGLSDLITEYADYLRHKSLDENFCDYAYDLLPFNLIVQETDKSKRQFKIIDSEWQLKTEFDADFVLFRALFWFAFENKSILKPFANATKLDSIGLFVCHFMPDIKKIDDLQDYVDLEESIQIQIGKSFRKKSVGLALHQRFDNSGIFLDKSQPACQIMWGNNDLVFDESHSVFIDWNKTTESQNLKSPLTFSKDKQVLRVDPIASNGQFEFNSIKLIDAQKNILWQLNSADEISSQASVKNLKAVSSSGNGQTSSFISLNNDPHFLFYLDDVSKLDKLEHIELSLALIQDQHYDEALATLSSIVNEQNASMTIQANGINEKLAEIAVLESELQHVKAHRGELKNSFNQLQLTSQQQTEQLRQHIANLEHSLAMRPLSRIKRVLKRLLKRDK